MSRETSGGMEEHQDWKAAGDEGRKRPSLKGRIEKALRPFAIIAALVGGLHGGETVAQEAPRPEKDGKAAAEFKETAEKKSIEQIATLNGKAITDPSTIVMLREITASIEEPIIALDTKWAEVATGDSSYVRVTTQIVTAGRYVKYDWTPMVIVLPKDPARKEAKIQKKIGESWITAVGNLQGSPECKNPAIIGSLQMNGEAIKDPGLRHIASLIFGKAGERMGYVDTAFSEGKNKDGSTALIVTTRAGIGNTAVEISVDSLVKNDIELAVVRGKRIVESWEKAADELYAKLSEAEQEK
ncbi:hypothetical protein HY625_00275 [Candidatus Uhrbacteria bacterium]|nr:hypothetical protein [Candidatus Uhrbacteria bacterium]